MKYKEILIHLICWLAFSTLIFYWQSNVFTVNGALLHTLRLTGIGALIFYINLYLLLPKFFEKGRYLSYASLTLLMLMMAASLFEFTSDMLPRPEIVNFRFKNDGSHPPQMPQGKILIHERRNRGRTIMFTFLNTIPMLFFSTIIWLTNENRKRKQREITLKNESLQSEMRFLKSQINPHFLFNALNNIYSLSFTKSEIAPQMIMKLSDMLRHVVYDSSNLVKIEKEISYINNFIDFQRLKTGTEINIRFDYEQADSNFMIEPMLLTPFVENAFKHSDIESNPDGYIAITLSTKDRKLRFEVENTYSEDTGKSTKDETPGIGIQNVTKRLELAYPERSRLTKESKDEKFKITLKLISR